MHYQILLIDSIEAILRLNHYSYIKNYASQPWLALSKLNRKNKISEVFTFKVVIQVSESLGTEGLPKIEEQESI